MSDPIRKEHAVQPQYLPHLEVANIDFSRAKRRLEEAEREFQAADERRAQAFMTYYHGHPLPDDWGRELGAGE